MYAIQTVHMDSWNGAENGNLLFFVDEKTARDYMRKYHATYNNKPSAPECYTTFTFVGKMQVEEQDLIFNESECGNHWEEGVSRVFRHSELVALKKLLTGLQEEQQKAFHEWQLFAFDPVTKTQVCTGALEPKICESMQDVSYFLTELGRYRRLGDT